MFDANAYGQARPDLDHLGRLAERLAGIGVETWVPEPVLWEWAEHLASDWEVLKNAAANERKQLQRAGLDVPAPAVYSAREDVVAAVLANVAKIPNVRIIELTGRSAIEGLKDQVLVRDPAKRKGATETDKKGVKTGASDSAWIRDILSLADPDEVLIVSKDRDVPAAFTAWNKPVPELRALNELRPMLFDFTVDDGHARFAIARYLRGRLPAGQLDEDALDIGRIVGLEAAYTSTRDGDGTSLSSYGASVTDLVALAGIGTVRIETEEASAPASTDRRLGPPDLGEAKVETADATVLFLATGEATVQTLVNGGDPEVAVISIENVLVRAHLSFEFVDGVITSMVPDTEAAAMIIEHAFRESEDLEQEVVTALNMVPGIADFDGGEGKREIDIPGTNAHVVLDMDARGDEWALEIGLFIGDDEEQELRGTSSVECEYDSSSWWGGSRDGFQGPDAYPVSVYGAGLHSTHGVWALPAWLIEHIDWPQFPVPAAAPVNHESTAD